MKIARVFPRKTKATPDDPLVFFGYPKKGSIPEVDEIHVSVTFTWDKAPAEYLAEQWAKTGIPVKIGGVAYDDKGSEFVPGKYLAPGYTITSRGCNNHCWFCDAWKREGLLRELEIKDGWNVLDSNILACSEKHIKAVFEMLKKQPKKPLFTGGLEAKILRPWHVELLHDVEPKEMFFAYDTPDDYEPLVVAGKMLNAAGFTLRSRKLYAFVLVGYPWDTFEKAKKRCIDTLKAGFIPFAMLYKDKSGFEDPDWNSFRRSWCRPAAIVSSNKEFFDKRTCEDWLL